jgi:hypothetical protein
MGRGRASSSAPGGERCRPHPSVAKATPDLPARGRYGASVDATPTLSPPPKLRLSCSHLVLLKASSRGVRYGGTGCGARESGPQPGTRAASGLPPGPLGVPARSWLKARSAQRCATDRTKAGPDAGKVRDWRAARRPPCPATDTDTKGLRLSARHPPHPEEGRRPFSKDRGATVISRTRRRRGKEPGMPCSRAATMSLPPLAGRSGVALATLGWGRCAQVAKR